MKLRLVVASLAALALVSTSSSVFATSKKHHKKHHEMAQEEHHEYKDYKGMENVPVCTITQTAMIMDETTQSIGRSMPNPCNPRWYDRIQVSGGINVDVGKFG